MMKAANISTNYQSPGITDLVNEEGALTNGQLQILADQARKSRAYVRHIVEDYGLFEIERLRFHELIMTQYSHARKDMYSGEDVEIDKGKENKEKSSACVCMNYTHPK